MGIIYTKRGDRLVLVVPNVFKYYSIQAYYLQKHAQVRKISLVVIP